MQLSTYTSLSPIANDSVPPMTDVLCHCTSDRQGVLLSASVTKESMRRQQSPYPVAPEENGKNSITDGVELPDEADSYVSANSTLDQDLDTEKGELREIFDHFDENKDGKISRDEMSRSLDRLGLSIPENELIAMIESADANSDGFVDFSEFVTLYHSLVEGKIAEEDVHSPSNNEADLKEAFDVFDKDGDGFICAEELQSVLSSMGLKKGRKLVECKNMISKVDTDGDGQVNFEEFKQMMTLGFGNG